MCTHACAPMHVCPYSYMCTHAWVCRRGARGGLAIAVPCTLYPVPYTHGLAIAVPCTLYPWAHRYAAEMLEEASPSLERFFGPYNELLREIIGPLFGWGARDHTKRKLDAKEKAAALEAIRKHRLNLRNRQVSRRMAEHDKAMQVRAAAKARGGGSIKGEKRHRQGASVDMLALHNRVRHAAGRSDAREQAHQLSRGKAHQRGLRRAMRGKGRGSARMPTEGALSST